MMARAAIEGDLPKFSGRSTDWSSFLTAYTSSTAACGFSSQENMLRLRNCLTGHNRDSVEMLLLSSKNADEIIEILSQNFGRPRQIIDEMMNPSHIKRRLHGI
jgi:hypothetical protein